MPTDLLSYMPNYKGIVEPGNIDLYSLPKIQNADGSFSTIRSATIGTDLGTVLIPTIIDGQELPVEQAIEYYKKTGNHLGIFSSEEEANRYDEAMHLNMGWTGEENQWN